MRPHALVILALTLVVPAGNSSAACDPGSSPSLTLTALKLSIKGFATTEVDDSIRLEGVVEHVTTFDPVASGLSIELSNQYFGSFVSADVPGGVGWRGRPRGAASYLVADGTHGGVTRIKLKPLADGTMAVAITGRRHPYASNDVRPFKVAMG